MSLFGQITDEQLKALPGRVRSPERVQQHLEAFALHLQGVSDRGVQKHFGWKSLSSAQNSIRRGEILARELNLDREKIRLKIAAAFDYIADVTVQQIKDQLANGRVTLIQDSEGRSELRKQNGVDVRLLGEAGRGLIRFAQFTGLMDADAATGGNEVSTNVVFISPNSDGASWDQQTQTVDVTSMSTEVSSDQTEAHQMGVSDGKGDSLQSDAPAEKGAQRVLKRADGEQST